MFSILTLPFVLIYEKFFGSKKYQKRLDKYKPPWTDGYY